MTTSPFADDTAPTLPCAPVPSARSIADAAVRRVRSVVDGRDSGFTLVEAIVSFVIFAMVAAAGLLALVAGMRSDNDTSDRVAASQLAQQETDRARAMPRASLTASPTTTSSRTVGNKTYVVTRKVNYLNNITACPGPSATPTAVSKLNVAVTVTIPGNGVRSVSVESVLAC